IKIRKHIYAKLSHAGLSDILIRKDKQRITIDIYTARPGIVIGKSGVEVDALRKEIHSMTHKNVHININEIKRPELDAKLVAQSIAARRPGPGAPAGRRGRGPGCLARERRRARRRPRGSRPGAQPARRGRRRPRTRWSRSLGRWRWRWRRWRRPQGPRRRSGAERGE